MNRSDFPPQIRKCWLFATALQIGELFSGPTALDPTDTFKALALDPRTSYEELYLAGLSESQYNILLTDLSYFQFGLGGTDGVRFAYYPNPFLGADRDAVVELEEMREYLSEGIIDMDEFLHKASEIRRSQHPPLVRYEYSKHQYVENTHPCSHIHFGFHGENRWPIKRYLNAHGFSLLIFRQFYLQNWIRADTIRIGENSLSLDAILQSVRAECRMLYAEEFSEDEDKRFYMI